MRNVLAALAGVALATTMAVSALPTPCPTEDSTGCTWDSTTQGNGTGRSFTTSVTGVVSYR